MAFGTTAQMTSFVIKPVIPEKCVNSHNITVMIPAIVVIRVYVPYLIKKELTGAWNPWR